MENDFASLAFLSLTFLAAGMVKGITGMGLPTVAMGVLGSVMPPATAAALLVVPSIATNVWQFLAGPATRRLVRRLWPMMLGIGLATALGSALLVSADPTWSAFALGVALMVYACYALVAPALSVAPRIEPWLSPVIGVATGAITGATGVLVMPAVPYLQALRLDKDELVQALGFSFTVSTVALAAGLMLHHALQPDHLGLSALAVVPALAGMWLGQQIRTAISPLRFRQCLLLFLGLLGMEMASRPFI